MYQISISCNDDQCFVLLQIRNEKARRYLGNMRRKPPVPFTHKFPHVDPLALRLLHRLLAFDPKDRPSAEEVSSSILVFSSVSTSKFQSSFNRSQKRKHYIYMCVCIYRHWQILTSMVWQTLIGNHLLNRFRNSSLSLKEGR